MQNQMNMDRDDTKALSVRHRTRVRTRLLMSLLKAKFHYAIWFEPASNQLDRPASVMEFGFNWACYSSSTSSHVLSRNTSNGLRYIVCTTELLIFNTASTSSSAPGNLSWRQTLKTLAHVAVTTDDVMYSLRCRTITTALT